MFIYIYTLLIIGCGVIGILTAMALIIDRDENKKKI
jgi:hypothetical protein